LLSPYTFPRRTPLFPLLSKRPADVYLSPMQLPLLTPVVCTILFPKPRLFSNPGIFPFPCWALLRPFVICAPRPYLSPMKSSLSLSRAPPHFFVFFVIPHSRLSWYVFSSKSVLGMFPYACVPPPPPRMAFGPPSSGSVSQTGLPPIRCRKELLLILLPFFLLFGNPLPHFLSNLTPPPFCSNCEPLPYFSAYANPPFL